MLERVIGQQPYAPDAQVAQDCDRVPVFARIDRKPQGRVGVNRVETPVLKRVSADLVDEPDAAALLVEVEEQPASGTSEASQRRVQLGAAIAALRAQHVPRQALRVEAQQDRTRRERPMGQPDDLARTAPHLENRNPEGAESGRKGRFREADHRGLGAWGNHGSIVPTKTAELQLPSSYHGRKMPPPSPVLRVSLLTRGDPWQRTGGHLYNQRMAQAAPRHGARMEILATPERPFPLAALNIPATLRRLDGAQIVVLDSIVAAESVPFIRSSARRQVVALLHQVPGGVDHGHLRTAIQARLDRRAYRAASRLIVVSEYLAAQMERSGFDRGRITIVPPGRDLVPMVPGQPAGDLRQGRATALLCVSNWRRNKGVGFLLEALARLPMETATLHLVGDDRGDPGYVRELRARIENDDLRRRVVVHGSLAPAALAGLYRTADILVFPSLREAYGTVCAEAMAAGLAVIASRTDNLPYLVRDGVDGLLCEPSDVDGLAAAIEILAVDPNLRRQLAESARRRALAFPTWEESAGLFFRELRQVADSGGQGAGARSV